MKKIYTRYKKTYLSIIRRAVERNAQDGVYYESHHIFPTSIFGKNKKTVLLTAREHYVVHMLLWKYYSEKYGNDDQRARKMCYAFWQMSNNPKINKKSSSRIYASLREQHARNVSLMFSGENSPNFGKKLSEETKKRISISRSGIPRSEQAKQRQSEISKGNKNRLGMTNSKESNLKRSKSLLGRKSPMKNKKHKNSTKQKIGLKNSKPIRGVNITTGDVVIYASNTEAVKDGFNGGHISSCCRGRLKAHKGYRWEFVESIDD